MRIALVRHATLLIEFAELRVLVDPMLDDAGTQPPIPEAADQRPNPLVALPRPAEAIVVGIDAAVVTHLHPDHIDATALRVLPRDVPVWCQAGQDAALTAQGLRAATALTGPVDVGRATLTPTGGRHGPPELAREMGPVMGLVLTAPDEPTLYVAGDTIYCEEVEAAIDAHAPDVIVVNAGAAQLTGSPPITMDVDDVLALAQRAPEAVLLAVHMEAINHCVLSRDDLRRAAAATGIADRVLAPGDGEMLELTAG